MEIELLHDSPHWHGVPLEDLAQRGIAMTLAHLEIAPEGVEVAILACDDARIADLNGQFRAKATPTNVLSWPASEIEAGTHPRAHIDGTIPLGDIAISYQTCLREAEAAGKPLKDHVLHLIVHGCLHLLGYDHCDDAEAAVMEGHEKDILGKLGLCDPYSK